MCVGSILFYFGIYKYLNNYWENEIIGKHGITTLLGLGIMVIITIYPNIINIPYLIIRKIFSFIGKIIYRIIYNNASISKGSVSSALSNANTIKTKEVSLLSKKDFIFSISKKLCLASRTGPEEIGCAGGVDSFGSTLLLARRCISITRCSASRCIRIKSLLLCPAITPPKISLLLSQQAEFVSVAKSSPHHLPFFDDVPINADEPKAKD